MRADRSSSIPAISRRGVLGFGLAALAGCGEGRALDRLAAGERGQVIEVRSGDVLVLDTGLVVRLVGLACPRLGEPGGDQARAALQALVGGRKVMLAYGGARRDAYGRALAQVRRVDDRRWIQGELLKAGWARVWTFADNRALAADMLNLEARARAQGLGLWALPAYRVALPAEIGPEARGFQIVEGRVASVSEGHAGTYLDFTPDSRGFSVLIDPRSLPLMLRSGVSPTLLAGHLLRVRGIVGWGGVMKVDHPEQIERLREP